MIDGIKLKVQINNKQKWCNETGLTFVAPVNLATGEVSGRKQKNNTNNISYIHSARLETYYLKLVETHYLKGDGALEIRFLLIVSGSLHKNYHGGRNVEPFSFAQLECEVLRLCKRLHLNPSACHLLKLEVGLNLRIPESAISFIKQRVLLYSTVPFVSYPKGKNGSVLGVHATRSQVIIKIYDKGLQFGLGYPLLRFEVRCIVMQYLRKYGIRTLADLLDAKKVKELCQVLLVNWDDVFLCDPKLSTYDLPLSVPEKELLQKGKSKGYWTELHSLNPRKFVKQRSAFRRLTAQYGESDFHSLIRGLIVVGIEEMFEAAPFLVAESVGSTTSEGAIFNLLVKDEGDSRTLEPTSLNEEEVSKTLDVSIPLVESDVKTFDDVDLVYRDVSINDFPGKAPLTTDVDAPGVMEVDRVGMESTNTLAFKKKFTSALPGASAAEVAPDVIGRRLTLDVSDSMVFNLCDVSAYRSSFDDLSFDLSERLDAVSPSMLGFEVARGVAVVAEKHPALVIPLLIDVWLDCHPSEAQERPLAITGSAHFFGIGCFDDESRGCLGKRRRLGQLVSQRGICWASVRRKAIGRGGLGSIIHNSVRRLVKSLRNLFRGECIRHPP
ncbi:MAG: hypothetical protein KF744_14440 [Taibaiella sp.]|nr:hypothetical protein [Taibaiella sp.]